LTRREPCELTRSPTIVGRGSWASAVALIIDDTRGAQPASARVGRGFARRPPTLSASTRMCSGVVPQQPPTIEMS